MGKAFVTLKANMTVTGEELKDYLLDKLAKYKIPKYYEIRDFLPKCAAGKILKRELD